MITESIVLYKEPINDNKRLLEILNNNIQQFFKRGHKLSLLYTSISDASTKIKLINHIYILEELKFLNGNLLFIKARMTSAPYQELTLSLHDLETYYV